MGLIAVDTSAVMAILFNEPEANTIADCLARHDSLIAPINFLEASIVATSRLKLSALDSLLAQFHITIHPTDAAQARLAREAYQRYGKGHHPAALNLGDCFAYALAEQLDAPLLFKGDDFARTDVACAI